MPFANVSAAAKRPIEVKLAEDLPTSLAITKLRPGAAVKLYIRDLKGKEVKIGQFKANTRGELELPTLTLTKSQSTIRMRIAVSGLSKIITIRS